MSLGHTTIGTKKRPHSHAPEPHMKQKKTHLEKNELRTQNEGDGKEKAGKEREMTTLWGKTICLRHHPKGLGLQKKTWTPKIPRTRYFWDLTASRSIFIASTASYTSQNVHDA